MRSQSRHSDLIVLTHRSARRICPRRSDRGLDDVDPFTLEDRVETCVKLGVAIVQKEAHRLRPVVHAEHEIARLLGYPGTIRRRGAVRPEPAD